jgi:hypothetical protein
MSETLQHLAAKTLFFNEGNKVALLVVNVASRRQCWRKQFVNANVALNLAGN